MTTSPQLFAPIRLASSLADAARGPFAYFVANGLDPAQARSEAVATIGRTVGYEASIIGSADIVVMVGVVLILALAIVLGLKRVPYSRAARPAYAPVPASLPWDSRRAA